MNSKIIITSLSISLLAILGFFLFQTCNKTELKENNFDKFGYNDISYLWPVPKTPAEVEKLISANSVIGNTSIWPEDSFNEVLSMAKDSLKIPNFPRPPKFKQIKFVYNNDSSLLQRKNWKVVGFRVDPSAPTAIDQSIIKTFGVIPQIRLILQPVTLNKGQVVVHDFTAHLPFGYTLNKNIPFKPDTIAFKKILDGIVILKNFLDKTGKASTDGLLQVNQGLANKVPGYAEKIYEFLSQNLPSGDLQFVSFMGLAPRPEPWIFFDMADGSEFQILNTQNSDSIAGKPIGKPNSNWEKGKGVSTAILYQNGVQLNKPAIKGLSVPLNKDIPNIIANPKYSNVLNTDCISCHSESTRRSILGLEGINDYKFTLDTIVKKDLLPTEIYNVRNFGWFRKNPIEEAKPIVSMRTANETAAALKFIKNNYTTNKNN